ncbi:U3 small nucleolar RNA-associated protein NOL7 [Balearica regulorum gibbericeps]|uniref:U3 small nucleolar RNA-associated protein NOL7 n=1 Tax=Balearica regulorum gibbericeps TaxID=100784 RepID=UPI003F5E9696
MARRQKAGAALLSPPSSEDEAPEEVSFGVAKEAAETERKLVGEAARRHRELLKEKRRRRQELFTEQKKRKLLPDAVLEELAAAPPARPDGKAAAGNRGKHGGDGAAKQRRRGQAQRQVKKDKQRKGARSKGNYTAVRLKDQSLTGLHLQLAKDFLNTQLYGPDTNRAQANEFFSLENKKNPVKKAAVQFVDKSWGQEKKQRAARFKKRWLSTQIKNQV